MYKPQKKLSLGRLIRIFSICVFLLGFLSVSWAAFNLWTPFEVISQDPVPGSAVALFKEYMESENTHAPRGLLKTSRRVPDKAMKGPKSPMVLLPSYSEGDVIGYLEIPALNRKVDLIEGTSKSSLQKGSGHFLQSVMPGMADNCVFSGHRDTVFRGIGKLKIGDQLIVKTDWGTFTYVISHTRVVDQDDLTVIVPTSHAVLTLTTCYPFRFIGNAPDRYVISADLVE